MEAEKVIDPLPSSYFNIKQKQRVSMTTLTMAGCLPKSTIEKPVKTERYPARYTSLERVREFVGLAAEQCGMEEKTIYQVQLAVDEAFTNIVEHAYSEESDELVECTCQIGEDGLTVILHDCGKAFDPTKVPKPDLNAPLEDRDVGGLGIYFMRKLMDDVRFMPAPVNQDGCNTLTMFKRKEKAV
jgi:serine/threonine-protein kinase RsbW